MADADVVALQRLGSDTRVDWRQDGRSRLVLGQDDLLVGELPQRKVPRSHRHIECLSHNSRVFPEVGGEVGRSEVGVVTQTADNARVDPLVAEPVEDVLSCRI